MLWKFYLLRLCQDFRAGQVYVAAYFVNPIPTFLARVLTRAQSSFLPTCTLHRYVASRGERVPSFWTFMLRPSQSGGTMGNKRHEKATFSGKNRHSDGGGIKWDLGLLIGLWMEPGVTFLWTAQLHLSCGSGRTTGSSLLGVLSAVSAPSKAMVEFSFKKDDVLQSSYLWLLSGSLLLPWISWGMASSVFPDTANRLKW